MSNSCSSTSSSNSNSRNKFTIFLIAIVLVACGIIIELGGYDRRLERNEIATKRGKKRGIGNKATTVTKLHKILGNKQIDEENEEDTDNDNDTTIHDQDQELNLGNKPTASVTTGEEEQEVDSESRPLDSSPPPPQPPPERTTSPPQLPSPILLNRQEEASKRIEYMLHKKRVFNTPFTTTEDVLRNGFPKQWKPCVIERRFLQKQQQKQHKHSNNNTTNDDTLDDVVEPFYIVVLGGSASARPGNACKRNGRYSDFLQEGLLSGNNNANANNPTTMKFHVENFAQGGTTSTLSALLLDQYININKTDLIIWEYSIDDEDSSGGNRQEERRKLDFWLTRIKVHFHQNGMKPPPILLNYLWNSKPIVGYKLNANHLPILEEEESGAGAGAGSIGDLIDSYRDLGWDIAVMNVGAVIGASSGDDDDPSKEETLVNLPTLLWDDADHQHPACAGTNLIANMIQHAIYTNLVVSSPSSSFNGSDTNTTTTTDYCYNSFQQDEEEDQHWKNHPESQSIVPPHSTTFNDNNKGKEKQETKIKFMELWEDLFQEDARIGSITSWQPHIPNLSNLNIGGKSSTVTTAESIVMGATQPSTTNEEDNKKKKKIAPTYGRQDRKDAMFLPSCQDGSLNITLAEPDLKWLGFHWDSSLSHHSHPALFVNEVPVDFVVTGRYHVTPLLTDWTNVLDYVEKSDTYYLSLCRPPELDTDGSSSSGDVFNIMTAVSIPPPPVLPTTNIATIHSSSSSSTAATEDAWEKKTVMPTSMEKPSMTTTTSPSALVETPTSSPPSSDDILTADLDFETNRNYAVTFLQEREEQRVFDTNFSSHEHVLENGFPMHWKPCTLRHRLQQQKANNSRKKKDPLLRLVVTGGSSSQRPSNNCGEKSRYVDFLEERLNRDTEMKFEVVTMAQGSCTSITAGLLMDELIDTEKTDIIIWEFGINDSRGKQHKTKLDFWLQRLKTHYAPKKPPPILLNFLWSSFCHHAIGQTGTADCLNLKPLEYDYAGEMVDYYRSLGWDIAVLNVGGSVNSTTLLHEPSLLFDDMHHPGCAGTNLIADMITHMLYSNLAVNSECPAQEINHVVKHPDTAHRETQPLVVQEMFLDNARVGSITAMEPRVHLLSDLNVPRGTLKALDNWPKRMMGKADPGRTDRKYTFVLPSCEEGSHSMRITLREPDLKWLGFNLIGNRTSFGYDLAVKRLRDIDFGLRINGQPISLSEVQLGSQYYTSWANVLDQVNKTDKYELSLCGSNLKRNQEKELLMGGLVAVSLPAPPARMLT